MAGAPGTVLVLVLDAGRGDGSIDAGRFVIALSLQLDPYGMGVQRDEVVIPSSLGAQARLAHDRGIRLGAAAVVWWTVERSESVLHLLDLRRDRAAVQSLLVGPAGAGIERSLAAAIRTLLRAAPLESAASKPALPRPARPGELLEPPATAVTSRQPILQLVLGYAVAGYPLGGDLRHGPDLGIAVRLWRRLELRAAFGYRIPRRGGDNNTEWSRSDWRFSLCPTLSLPVARRLALVLGVQAGFSAVVAEARMLGSTSSEGSTMWEALLGGVAGLALGVTRRLTLELTASVGGLPVRHSLRVRGVEVERSGALELGLVAGLRTVLW